MAATATSNSIYDICFGLKKCCLFCCECDTCIDTSKKLIICQNKKVTSK